MKAIPLSGTDYPVNPVSYSQVLWLLQRYSSFAYIGQMYRLMASFVAAYEKHSVARKESAVWMRDVFAKLYRWQGFLEKGLSRLRLGDRSGLSEIADGLSFADYLVSPRFEHGRDFEEIGFDQYAPATGLWAWGERSIIMAKRVEMTIHARWSFETLLDRFAPTTVPAILAPLPPNLGAIVAPGEDAPTSGAWLPLDVPLACPNYRVQGHVDVGVRIPTSRTDIPVRPAAFGLPERPAKRIYEFKHVSTRWQLIWEDRRYASGDLPPEEAEYLDESTALPNDAATPVPPFPFRDGS
jgi:hypothetical protein